MVGYTLRQERERQNLSVNDIEEGTSIRATYIEAIENGEYDKLPGKVYTKGFIKNYAKFLGLDTDAVAKEFAADMNELESTPETPQDAEESTKQPEKPAEVKSVKQERKPLGHSVQETNSRSSSKLIVAAIVLIAALAGSAWAFLSNSDDEVAKVNPPAQEQPVKPEPVPENKPAPVANANPEPKSDKVEVQARFNDRCWVLVTIDGAVVQEGVVDGGQTLTWEGKDNITFRLGNAGAVEFFQDGKSLGVLGGIGDIADKTFTRN